MRKDLDPFLDPKVKAEWRRLQNKYWKNECNFSDAAMATLLFGMMGVPLSGIVCLVGAELGVPEGLANLLWGLLSVVIVAGTMGYQAFHLLGTRKWKELEREVYMEFPDNTSGNALYEVAEGLKALPYELRLEHRPLWESAVEAHSFIETHGYEEVAMDRIRVRREVVESALAAYRALEEEQRKDAAQMVSDHRALEKAAALARLSSSNDDLIPGQSQAEALQAGGAVYRELRTSRMGEAAR